MVPERSLFPSNTFREHQPMTTDSALAPQQNISTTDLPQSLWRYPTLTSNVTLVTFFEDRAEVQRQAQYQATPGPQWVCIPHISPVIDDRSLQVGLQGPEGAMVLAARVLRRLHLSGALGREAIDALTAQALAHDQQAQALQQELARIDTERQRADNLLTQWVDAISQIPKNAHKDDGLTPWQSSFSAIQARSAELITAHSQTLAALNDAQRAAALARAHLSAASHLQPLHETCIEIQLDASPSGGTLTLTATYRLPCALWRPEHLARLLPPSSNTSKDTNNPHTIEWLTWATVWQSTGEEWSNTKLAFSTARPAQTASPPLLNDDILYTRHRSQEEQQVITIQAHEQSISHSAQTSNPDIPGVDDGGQPLLLLAPYPMTIPSNGQPVRVELDRRTLNVQVSRLIVPAVSEVAHLVGRTTVTSSARYPGLPLLAGPVHIAREHGWMGRTKLDLTTDNEHLELGFGPDDAIRIRRLAHQKRLPPKLSGQQIERRHIQIFLSNLSDTEREVEILDRIPISEIKEVQIEPLEQSPNWTTDEDGFKRLTLTLAPLEHRELFFKYEVRASSKVRLPEF